MFGIVKEIDKGPRPTINADAMKVYDHKNRTLYIYGGTRLPANDNTGSPTNKPTADFFCLNFYSSPLWRNYSFSMREDESLISPFRDELCLPEKSGLELPKLGSLPALQDPIGTIVHDETASRTSYLLILGNPVGKTHETYNHPILLCINLRLNAWRVIDLKNTKKVQVGRSRASMIVLGEIRSEESDIFLCVFGGIRERVNDEVKTVTSMNTYAVANLSKGVWTTPNGKVPDAVGPLGINPGLTKYRDARQNREYIFILRGAVEQQNDNFEMSTEATFLKGYLFNPRAHNHHFTEVQNDSSSLFPSPVRVFTLQPSQARRSCDSKNTFLLVTVGDQRRLNEIPPRPDEPKFRDRVEAFYYTPQVQLWMMEIQESTSDTESESDSEQEPYELDVEQTSSSEDDDISSSEEDEPRYSVLNQVGTRSKCSSVLAQVAKRFGPQPLRTSRATLMWRNMTSGHVRRSLDLLSSSFRIEVVFLSGDISARFDSAEQSTQNPDHPLSPKLVLLGCDYEYSGEILGDLYNGFASISLLSIFSSDESEEETASCTMSATEMSVSDDEMLPFEGHESEFTFPQVVDKNLGPAFSRRLQGADAFLLLPRSNPELLDFAD